MRSTGPRWSRPRQILEQGAIGEVITARSWHCSPPMPEFFEGDDPWRFSAAATGGGIAIDAGSHWLRPLRMWLGEINEVFAVTARVLDEMEGESLCRALCRFESGVVASFDAVLTPGPAAPVAPFQLTGTKGEIVVEHGRVLLYRRERGAGSRRRRRELLHELRSPDRRFRGSGTRRCRACRVGRATPWGSSERRLPCTGRRHSGRWEPVW